EQLWKNRERLLQRDDDGRVIRSGDSGNRFGFSFRVILSARDWIERPASSSFCRRIERAPEATDDVLRRERTTVLKFHAGSQMERVCQAIGRDCPFTRKAG